MGAWIETTLEPSDTQMCASHPTWVRGLKRFESRLDKNQTEVAPYVGAWIETGLTTAAGAAAGVAPYVGAWIET